MCSLKALLWICISYMRWYAWNNDEWIGQSKKTAKSSYWPYSTFVYKIDEVGIPYSILNQQIISNMVLY